MANDCSGTAVRFWAGWFSAMVRRRPGADFSQQSAFPSASKNRPLRSGEEPKIPLYVRDESSQNFQRKLFRDLRKFPHKITCQMPKFPNRAHRDSLLAFQHLPTSSNIPQLTAPDLYLYRLPPWSLCLYRHLFCRLDADLFRSRCQPRISCFKLC